jgi:methyl-accepting chemotaxis protein
MKIGAKITLFVLANLALYLVSFGLTQFYNDKTYKYQSFNSNIKNFETRLLSTIILEKDYARTLDKETAAKVLSDIEKNAEILKKILSQAIEKEMDLQILLNQLATYKEKFSSLLSNNNEIGVLKERWDKLFDSFYAKSEQLAQEVDNTIGLAYINGEDVDISYNSIAISNKNILNALSAITLALNKDLLLNSREDIFLKSYQKALELLNKERKNIAALAESSERPMPVDISDYMEKNLFKFEELTQRIHTIWQENIEIVSRLDAVRKKMIAKEKEISADIQASLEEIRKTNFISALVIVMMIFAVLILGGVIIMRSISRPIKKLISMVIDLAEGEGDLSMRLELRHRDEMGDMAKWFNRFIEKIQSMIRDIIRNSETLNTASSNYLNLSGQMSRGADRMSEISNSVSTATEEMSMSISTIASAAEEMSVTIQSVSSTAEQMSRNMNAVTGSIEDMSDAITDIAQNAQKGSSISTEAMDMAKSATAVMNKLGDATTEIGEVTKLITRIAEQTNLLALNATIEAASAGDAGRGFAVVAGEIKELANKSARAAENIARSIDGVQKNIGGAVRVIEDISGIIGKINESVLVITDSVEQQTHTANDIMYNVREASIGSSNIAASIAEIAKGANEMSSNAGEAVKGSNDMAYNIQSISEAAGEANNRARKVNDSAVELADIAVQLREMVGRFKVE